MFSEISKYSASGILGTVVHYIVMYLLLTNALSPVLATSIGAMIGALVNFMGCRQWVFKHAARTPFQAFFRFAVTALLILIINAGLVWLLTPTTGVWSAQLVATLGAFLVGYWINRNWTFSTRDLSLL